MYSKKIQSVLKRKGIKIGHRVRLEKSGKVYEGLLMPKTEVGDTDCIVLKLDNGYNMGIEFKGSVKLGKSKESHNVKEEGSFELGKVKKGLLNLDFDKKKPKVSLIAAGGTVASRVDYKTGGVSALMNPKEFLHNVPELGNIINLRRILQPVTKMSEDLDYLDWQAMAKSVARELNSGSRGVILTHGTDTLHFTSAVLSFFLRNLTKPVVVLGSQRSSDRGSSDAGMNLICAAYAAAGGIAGVNVCMHGTMNDDHCLLIRGTHVRKMHTSRRDAFRPINELPLAKIWPDGRLEHINKNYTPRQGGKVVLDLKFEPRVALIKTYPGADPGVMDYYLGKKYRGFVIEGTGLGHVPTSARKSWTAKIKKVVKDGVPVVVTSQTIYGRVNPNVYTNLRILYHETKAIPGEDMLSEVAYVKLGWVLGHTKNPEKAREMMLTNYAGEIAERTLPGTFLY